MAKKTKKKIAKKKPAPPKKMGRPEIPIDFESLKELVGIQCTADECSAVLGVSVDTLERRIKKEYGVGWREFRQTHLKIGHSSLRRAQWKKGLGDEKRKIPPDSNMLKWLGKQYLGQSERARVEHSGPQGGPIATVDHTMKEAEIDARIAELLKKQGGEDG